MKLVVQLMGAIALFAPSVALACPYGSRTCDTCSSSLLGYGAWLLLGLGVGIASVAFEGRRSDGPKARV